MTKKFELTQNKKNWEGRTLYQIKALLILQRILV